MDIKRSVVGGLVGIAVTASPGAADAFLDSTGNVCSIAFAFGCNTYTAFNQEVVWSVIHKVQPGETLLGIVKKYKNSGADWQEIAKDNNIQKPELLQAGSYLRIRY